MRFHLHRIINDPDSKSVFGELYQLDGGFQAHTCERMWDDNKAGSSCVPEGFYVLEPHNGTKYKNTFALIGETVSHIETPLIPRSACVFHWSAFGKGLQGCVSMSKTITFDIGNSSRLTKDQTLGEFRSLLQGDPGPHYLTISGHPPS